MQIASQDAAAPLDQYVAEIDDGASWLRAYVAPVRFGIFGTGGEDLETADYVEDHGHGARVGVSNKADAMVRAILWAGFEQAECGVGGFVLRAEGC